MQVNDSSTAAARLYAQAAAPTGAAQPQPIPESDAPVPAANTDDSVTISDEGMAKVMGDNPGNWPDPPAKQ